MFTFDQMVGLNYINTVSKLNPQMYSSLPQKLRNLSIILLLMFRNSWSWHYYTLDMSALRDSIFLTLDAVKGSFAVNKSQRKIRWKFCRPIKGSHNRYLINKTAKSHTFLIITENSVLVKRKKGFQCTALSDQKQKINSPLRSPSFIASLIS